MKEGGNANEKGMKKRKIKKGPRREKLRAPTIKKGKTLP